MPTILDALEQVAQAMERTAGALENAANGAGGGRGNWADGGIPTGPTGRIPDRAMRRWTGHGSIDEQYGGDYGSPAPGLSWPGQTRWPGSPGGSAGPGGGFLANLFERYTGTKWSEAGPLGKAAGIGTAAGVGVTFLGSSLQGLAERVNKLGDPFLDVGQKMQALREGIPVVGGLLKGLREFGEALSGVAAQLAQQEQLAQLIGTISEGRMAGAHEEAGLRTRGAGLQAVAGARWLQQRQGFAGLGVADPAQPLDPLQMARFGRQVGYATQRQTLEAEQAGLSREGVGLAAELDRLEKARTGAADFHGRASARVGHYRAERERLGRPVAKGELDQAMRDQLQGAQELQRIEEQIKKTKEEAQTNALAQAEKEKQIGLNRLESEKEKLSLLREQEGVLRGTASSFYDLHGGQREMILAWKKQADTKGFGSLLPQQVRMMAQMGGAGVQRWAERNIMEEMSKDPKFKEFAGAFARGDALMQGADLSVTGNVRQQVQLEKTLADLGRDVEAKAAAAFAAAFGKSIDGLVKAIDDVVNARVRELQARLQHGHLQRGGN